LEIRPATVSLSGNSIGSPLTVIFIRNSNASPTNNQANGTV
jgi:hypothetical protein